jgi:hypothetical protein
MSAAITAVALLAAALGHGLAAIAHSDSPGAVAFFVAAAITQLGLALALLRGPSPTTWRLVAVTSIALLVAWGVSRTVGTSVGRAHAGPESVGPLDLSVVAAQVVALLAARASATRRRNMAVLTTGIASLALVLLVAAIAPDSGASSHHHARRSGEPTRPHSHAHP